MHTHRGICTHTQTHTYLDRASCHDSFAPISDSRAVGTDDDPPHSLLETSTHMYMYVCTVHCTCTCVLYTVHVPHTETKERDAPAVLDMDIFANLAFKHGHVYMYM